MKTSTFYSIIICLLVCVPVILSGQIKATSTSVENEELRDLLMFEEIKYQKLNFVSSDLADKTYQIFIKEIWDGEITKDTILHDSRNSWGDLDVPEEFKVVGDTVFTLKVISKRTEDNQLKMQFMFPRFATVQYFDATPSDEYSLRSAINTETVPLDEKFYAMVYMLPYEEGNMKHYCAVESSGKDIESWGKEFGIEHYLVFEMIFSSL